MEESEDKLADLGTKLLDSCERESPARAPDELPAYQLPGTWLRPPGRRQIRRAAPGAGSEKADRWEAILAAAGISHEALDRSGEILYFGPESYGHLSAVYDTGISSGALTKCYISGRRIRIRKWGNCAYLPAHAGHEPPLPRAPMYRLAPKGNGTPPP